MYESNESTYSYRGRNSYVEIHEIVNGTPGPGIPMSRKVAEAIGKSMLTTAFVRVGGFVTDRLIYCAHNGMYPVIVWYTEPMQMKMHYTDGLSKSITDGKMWLPWLVWNYDGKALKIYACKEKPSPATVMYHAPFHNTNESGGVCIGGGVRLMKEGFTSYEFTMEQVQAVFFGTKFSGAHHTNVAGNINTLHKNLIESGDKFPLAKLKSYKKTLSQILNSKDEQHQNEAPELHPENEG